MTAPPFTPPPDPQSVFQSLLALIGRERPQAQRTPTMLEAIRAHVDQIAAAALSHPAPTDATAVPVQPKPGDDFTTVAQAKWEMANLGITGTQRLMAYKGRLSDAAYANITPYGYTGHGQQFASTLAALVTPKAIDTNPDRVPAQRDVGAGWKPTSLRDDAWRLYLGLPQANGTFGISDHRPSTGRATKPYFKINGYEDSELFQDPSTLKTLVEEIDDAGGKARQLADPAMVMGEFRFGKGKDAHGSYVSYYDVWDLAHPSARFVGHPFEIYDRIYYDPKTFKVIQPRGASSTTPNASQKEQQRAGGL